MCETPLVGTRVLAIGGIYISTRHLPFAAFLTVIEVFQVSTSQERASSKRFPLCLCRAERSAMTAAPPADALDRASAERPSLAKLIKIFQKQIIIKKMISDNSFCAMLNHIQQYVAPPSYAIFRHNPKIRCKHCHYAPVGASRHVVAQTAIDPGKCPIGGAQPGLFISTSKSATA